MGWCDACEGLGVQQGASPAAIVVHPTWTIGDGAIGAWGALEAGSKLHAIVSALADFIGFNLSTPWNELTDAQRIALLHGCGDEWIELGERPRRLKPAAQEDKDHSRGLPPSSGHVPPAARVDIERSRGLKPAARELISSSAARIAISSIAPPIEKRTVRPSLPRAGLREGGTEHDPSAL